MTECITCPVYSRKPTEAVHGWLTCRVDHDRIARHLEEMPGQFARLNAAPGAAPGGAKVSGSRERSLGVRVGVLDLMLPATLNGVTDTGKDQVGSVSVPSLLDSWVEAIIAARDEGEHRPAPTVANLCTWLLHRLDWICQSYTAVPEFASEVRTMIGALYAANGDVPAKPDHKTGVPCRRCDRMTLHDVPGDRYIECSSCGTLYTQDEYDTWVGLLSGALTPEQRASVEPARPVVIPKPRRPVEDTMIIGYKGPAVLTARNTRMDVQVDLRSERELDGSLSWGGTITAPAVRVHWFDQFGLEIPGRPFATIECTSVVPTLTEVTLHVSGVGAAPYTIEQRNAQCALGRFTWTTTNNLPRCWLN